MKKQTSAMRGILVCLLAFFTLTLNSCKKQLLLNESEELKGALSVSEAKSYFVSKFPVSKKGSVSKSTFTGSLTLQALFADKQPIWDMAYQKMISTGGAVKIPLDLGDAYAVVNEKTKAIVPAASLNYLLMYKDARDSIHAEWVRLAPDSAWLYGKRDSYKGKIFIYDWNGKQIKSLNYGNTYIQQKTQISNRAATQNSNGTIEIEDCYRFSSGRCPKTGVCDPKCDMCLSTCAYEICIVTTEPICQNCPENPPRPGGGGSGSGGDTGSSSEGGGGSGAPSPADYAPNCNPDPNYVVPSYPAPQGTDWMMPCGGDVPIPETPGDEPRVSYEGLDISTGVLTLANKLDLSQQEALFLESHQDIVTAIDNYLQTNNGNAESKHFAKWAVGYLRLNMNFNYHTFFDTNEFSGIYNPPINVAEESLISNGITIGEVLEGAPQNQNRIIGSAPKRHGNNPEDLQYGTNGNTTGIFPSQINLPTQTLFNNMRELMWQTSIISPEMRAVTGLMVDKFESNVGGVFENATLTAQVKRSVQFQNFLRKFGDRLSEKLTLVNGNIDNVLEIPTNDIRPKFTGVWNKFAGLQIAINDTEANEIKLLNFKTEGGVLWSADVEVTIYDNFGLDKADALKYQAMHRGFAAWWLLQHTRGYKPFVTKVVIKSSIGGRY